MNTALFIPFIGLAKNNEGASKGRDLLRLIVKALNRKYAQIGLNDDLQIFSFR